MRRSALSASAGALPVRAGHLAVESIDSAESAMSAAIGHHVAPIPGPNIVRDLHQTMGRDSDRSAMIQVAEDEGVTALLWESLASADAGDTTLRDEIAPSVRGAATRELLAQIEIRRVSERFARERVRALIIKGTALAYTAYASAWHRPRTDTDLLIHPDDAAESVRVLESCGYERSDAVTAGSLVSHQAAFERVDGHGLNHVIDLHWRLVNPQILANTLSFEYLWDRARLVPALGPDARTPSAIDAVLIASIHRLAHHQGQDRLIWLCDLHLLTAPFTDADWNTLAAAACRFGVAGLCLDGLRQARARTGTRIPPRVEELWQDAAPAERSHVYVSGPVLKRDVLASDLAELTGWRARARLVKEHAFPPAAFMRARYGIESAVWLPSLYVHRLVTGAFKWLRH